WRMPLEGGEPVRIGLKMPHLRHFAISPDGRRFLFTAGQSSEEIWVVENIFGGESSEKMAHSKP
ncbi:MAG TPA: hypothetical protein VM557_03555, partial [Thermoanaerobaculia bacterium]|nr:hypothetical protein [Thermoanaerobaculia bacterium]